MTENTVEELFKTSTELLDRTVRNQLILSKVAERGYEVKTEEEAAEVLKIANEIGEALMTGQVSPIPAAALESDGQLSKHASDKAEADFFAFAPDVEIDLNAVDPNIKRAAAMTLLLG